MKSYPWWKNLLVLVAITAGIIYSLPNLYGEVPAVQIGSLSPTVKVTPSLGPKIEAILTTADVKYRKIIYRGSVNPTIQVSFFDTAAQFKAKSLLEKGLNSGINKKYVIVFNLLSSTPDWLQAVGALPMNLGLDLRGGVHFLMAVDTKGVIKKRLKGILTNVRAELRKARVRYRGLVRLEGQSVRVTFSTEAIAQKAQQLLKEKNNDLQYRLDKGIDSVSLLMSLKPEVIKQSISESVKQNMATLHNRVNELGVAEPVIQRQGVSRILVELPGIQDVARAKNIIGRTATLEVRMVDDSIARGTEMSAAIPGDSELFTIGRGAPVVLKRDVTISGDYITNAAATFDQQNQPVVAVDLNSEGGRRMREVTRTRVGKPMAIVLFDKGQGSVLTVATIRDILGSRFQITGMGSVAASNDLALLLRAGSLAAPMEIIEERTVGPQLGAENIKKGIDSVLYGFIAIVIFMVMYYLLFGIFSVVALSVNLLFLVALLSMLQATLTLPGFAAMALALGMAIDANVLINERIREELRDGATPHVAINAGFDRAWATILDSNITTLIAGICLVIFGSGALRGFGVVHSLGILTSLFSAVLVVRSIVNFWYGKKRKLHKVSIG